MLRAQALSRTTAGIVRVGSVTHVGTMRTIGLTTLCFVGGFFAGATFVFAIGMLLAVVFAIDGPYEALLQKMFVGGLLGAAAGVVFALRRVRPLP